MNNTLTVSEITAEIKNKFEKHINKYYCIVGEVVNSSDRGHVYFSLKDELNTSIRCILWKGTKDKNNYSDLKNGEIITISGKISVYEKNNSYSFNVFKMIKEETKETEYETKYNHYKSLGYFDKKTIPAFEDIKCIGLVTSAVGEAVEDFKKTISNRFAFSKIYVRNVKVQGQNCARDVIKAIDFFETTKQIKVDVICITRGGGSSIDLDEFNDVNMVERIYKCEIPVFSAIGHEKDNTLCQEVSDFKTSTPTALALAVSEDFNKIKNKVSLSFENDKLRFNKYINNFFNEYKDHKTNLYRLIAHEKPSGFLFQGKSINTVEEFKKLCDEKFTIKLNDGVINFNISDFTITPSNKYDYSKYKDFYDSDVLKHFVESCLNKTLEDRFNKLDTLEFGSKQHFMVFKIALVQLTYLMEQLKELESIEEINCIYGQPINDISDLVSFKYHLNWLETSLNNDFVNCDEIMVDKKADKFELYQKYLDYNKLEGLSQEFVELYMVLKNFKVKYYKLK